MTREREDIMRLCPSRLSRPSNPHFLIIFHFLLTLGGSTDTRPDPWPVLYSLLGGLKVEPLQFDEWREMRGGKMMQMAENLAHTEMHLTLTCRVRCSWHDG